MAVNTNFNIPFIPQEGITQQVLAAIQLANEHQFRQRQLAQQAPLVAAQTGLAGAQAGLAGAQTEDVQQQIQQRQLENDLRRRMFGYVFGNPQASATPTAEGGGQGATFADDVSATKARLNLSPEESAAYDAATKQVQIGLLSTGKMNTEPLEKVIQAHLSREEKTSTTLTKFKQHEGTDPTTGWFEEARTADGKVAFRVPAPPPAEYLPTTSQGTDIIRAVNAQTGEVTATPVETSRTTTKSMGGAGAGVTAPPAPRGGSARPGAPFAVAGGGKKLSEAGQGLVTGLTQATDLTEPALQFLEKPPSYVDWQTARLKYAAGIDPGPGYTQAFQAIGLMRAIATGPLLRGVRNPKIIRGIQDHLPSLGDSPELVKQKITDLKPFWKQAMDEVYKTEQVKPPTGMSDEATKYLQSIGAGAPQ